MTKPERVRADPGEGRERPSALFLLLERIAEAAATLVEDENASQRRVSSQAGGPVGDGAGPWLKAEQVAADLGVDVVTVYRRMRSGRLRAIKIGRRWRTRVDWLNQWLESGGPGAIPTRRGVL